MEVESNYAVGSEREVVESLLRAPGKLRPRWFGLEEDVIDKSCSVEDKEKFDRFLERKESMFFLYGEHVTYFFHDSHFGDRNVFCEVADAGEAQTLMGLFCIPGLKFAFAASKEERSHRNGLWKRASYGSHQALVGVDYRRWLPGLYWLTLISNDLIKSLDIDSEGLSHIAAECSTKGACNSIFLRLYDAPDEWEARKIEVDKYCASARGIFSIDSARAEFAEATSVLESLDVVDKWK